MADVVYRIIMEGTSSAAADSAPKSVAITPKGEEMTPGKALVDGYNKIRNFAPVALALKYAHTAIQTGINRVELRTGRATYQQQQQWTYSTVMKGAGIVTAIATGLLTSNYLVAAGGVVAALDTAIDYGIAAQNIDLERRVENIGIGMANIRAGAGGDRHGRAAY